MSGLPPTIDSQNLPETPPAPHTAGTNTLAVPKDSTLPSKEVPGGSGVGVGSLPGQNSEAGVAKLPEERAKEGMSSTAQDSAKQYIPTTQGLGETAKKYVPQSVAAYLPGSTPAKAFSLPSTEVPSGSAGGVGSLPGTASEVSVAKLPEERRQEGLPSHETDHERLGKTGGVGPLPGGPNESGVALLPEERIHGEDEIMRPSSGNNAPVKPTADAFAEGPQFKSPGTYVSPSGAGVVHSDLGHKSNGSGPAEQVAQTKQGVQDPSHPQSKTEKAKGSAQEAKNKVASALPGHSGPTGPSSTPPTSSAPTATSATTSPTAAAPPAQTGTEHQPSGHRGSTGSSGTHLKVGFMDKMKGEAKIISGKLGKNEKKIEEGRHLMGKA